MAFFFHPRKNGLFHFADFHQKPVFIHQAFDGVRVVGDLVNIVGNITKQKPKLLQLGCNGLGRCGWCAMWRDNQLTGKARGAYAHGFCPCLQSAVFLGGEGNRDTMHTLAILAVVGSAFVSDGCHRSARGFKGGRETPPLVGSRGNALARGQFVGFPVPRRRLAQGKSLRHCNLATAPPHGE